MEYITIVDKNGNPLGYHKERHDDLIDGEFAIVVHLWIINSKGEYLVQQRAASKKVDPFLWSITAGFVNEGENSLETIKRELREELDEKLIPNSIDHVYRLFPKAPCQHIADVYILHMDVDLDTVMLQVEEVNDIAFWTKEKILENKQNNIFKDFGTMYDDYFEKVFGVELWA